MSNNEDDTPPFCINCKHCFQHAEGYACSHPEAKEYNLVTGEEIIQFCNNLRTEKSDFCRNFGDNFEEKDL